MLIKLFFFKFRICTGSFSTFWTGKENLAITEFRIPDRPVHFEPLYRIRCLSCQRKYTLCKCLVFHIVSSIWKDYRTPFHEEDKLCEDFGFLRYDSVWPLDPWGWRQYIPSVRRETLTPTVQHDIQESLNSQKQRCGNLRSYRIEVECIVIKIA
jgi:hypothetical protein